MSYKCSKDVLESSKNLSDFSYQSRYFKDIGNYYLVM